MKKLADHCRIMSAKYNNRSQLTPHHQHPLIAGHVIPIRVRARRTVLLVALHHLALSQHPSPTLPGVLLDRVPLGLLLLVVLHLEVRGHVRVEEALGFLAWGRWDEFDLLGSFDRGFGHLGWFLLLLLWLDVLDGGLLGLGGVVFLGVGRREGVQVFLGALDEAFSLGT